jgi:hypothetical protein
MKTATFAEIAPRIYPAIETQLEVGVKELLSIP